MDRGDPSTSTEVPCEVIAAAVRDVSLLILVIRTSYYVIPSATNLHGLSLAFERPILGVATYGIG